MYLNKDQHILSSCLALSAMLNMFLQLVNVIIRMVWGRYSSEPDMLNDVIWYSQVITQAIIIAFTCYIFYRAIIQLRTLESKFDADDSDELGLLQKEYLSNQISTLKLESIYQLLQTWAGILVWTEVMYILTSAQYRDFVSKLYATIPTDTLSSAYDFADIYNSTHGFKYIGMFTALILGLFVTGVFLRDRTLKTASIVLSIVFMIAFGGFQMVTFVTSVKIISIVWTSVIFHCVETVGLVVLAMYLSRHYKGL